MDIFKPKIKSAAFGIKWLCNCETACKAQVAISLLQLQLTVKCITQMIVKQIHYYKQRSGPHVSSNFDE